MRSHALRRALQSTRHHRPGLPGGPGQLYLCAGGCVFLVVRKRGVCLERIIVARRQCSLVCTLDYRHDCGFEHVCCAGCLTDRKIRRRKYSVLSSPVLFGSGDVTVVVMSLVNLTSG